MNTDDSHQRATLRRIARRAMLDRGLAPDFAPEAIAELAGMQAPVAGDGTVRDLRALSWASIDNDDSRDLDQLTVAERLPQGLVRLLVAIADVDALVGKGSAIDGHARPSTISRFRSPPCWARRRCR